MSNQPNHDALSALLSETLREETVKRYSETLRRSPITGSYTACMAVQKGGGYVRSSDYAALACENARLTRERDDLQQRFNVAHAAFEALQRERDALAREIEGMREALVEADEYLSQNGLNYIGSGSQLHRQIKAALASSREPSARGET